MPSARAAACAAAAGADEGGQDRDERERHERDRRLRRTASVARCSSATRSYRSAEQRRIAVRQRVHELLLEVGRARADRRSRHALRRAPGALDLRAQPVEQVALLAPGPHGRLVVELDLRHEQPRVAPRAAVFFGSRAAGTPSGLGVRPPHWTPTSAAGLRRPHRRNLRRGTPRRAPRAPESPPAMTPAPRARAAEASSAYSTATLWPPTTIGTASPARSSGNWQTPAPVRSLSTRRVPVVSARSSRPRAARSSAERRSPAGEAVAESGRVPALQVLTRSHRRRCSNDEERGARRDGARGVGQAGERVAERARAVNRADRTEQPLDDGELRLPLGDPRVDDGLRVDDRVLTFCGLRGAMPSRAAPPRVRAPPRPGLLRAPPTGPAS